MSDVNGVSGQKKPNWMDEGPDPSTKTADGIIGDKLRYKGSTKTGVDEARFERDVDAAKEMAFEAIGGVKNPLLVGESLKKALPGLGFAVAKFTAEERKAYLEGKKSRQDVAKDIATFVADKTSHLGLSVLGGGGPAVAFTMVKAICSSVPKALEDEKNEKQLFHDEAVKLHVAEHFKGELPASMYRSMTNDMSLFGQTYRTSATVFDDSQLAFETALKASPALKKDIEARFWHGKAAAIELDAKDDAKFMMLMNPFNKDPKAVAFRKAYSDPTNVAFKMGVDAIRAEAGAKDEKTQELYAKDLARYEAEKKSVYVPPTVTIKG